MEKGGEQLLDVLVSALMWKSLLLLICVLACVGCAAVEYTPYEGSSKWRTASGAFVNRKHGMPIYDGLPPRPYRVIGFINTSAGTSLFSESADASAVRVARGKNADALVLLSKEDQLAGVSGMTSFFPMGYSAMSQSSMSYLKLGKYVAIQWE